MKKAFLTVLFILPMLGIHAQEVKLPDHSANPTKPLTIALEQRRTIRNFETRPLDMQAVSNLLWSAYGYNRPQEHKRTAPSARNVQEFDIYFFDFKGVWLYDAEHNSMKQVVSGDHRKEISSQTHFSIAPVSVVIVANYDRIGDMLGKERDFYAAIDAGYVSQNIYLYCAASDLGTVACGAVDREGLNKLLGIKNGKVMLAHPVGYPKSK